MGSLQRRGAPFAGEAGRALRELHLSRVPKNQLGRDVCPRLKSSLDVKGTAGAKARLSRSELKQMQARGMWLSLRCWRHLPPPCPANTHNSSPNICSGEKELAELLLDIQQGPSVLSPPLLGMPPGSEWRRRRLKI